MKNFLFLSAALMLSMSSALAQNNSFSVKANLKNFSNDTILVYKGRGAKMDTLLMKNDKFAYITKINKPMHLAIATTGTFRGTENKMIDLIAIPGEKAELVGDLAKRFDIYGSAFYKQYHAVDLMLEEAKAPLRQLQASLSKSMSEGGDRDALMKEYQEKAPALEKSEKERIFSYISQHSNEDATATLVGEFETLDDMNKVVGMLSESVRNGRMKDFYEPYILQLKAQKEAEEKAAKIQAAGVAATDFTLKDIHGNDFKLSSLRGKYIILDFWGSWCGWCIKGMPQMKEYYKKYFGKFEIVGVDCNDTEEKWKAAVKKHDLPWIHVYNKRGTANDVAAKYAIQGFPTKIIVGPDGKIVKTITGEDPAFYTFLDETFGK